MASPDTCPNCGADVPARARACPECGADERTGWSDDAVADRLGLPGDGEFDHDDFVRREFGGNRTPKRSLGWWVLIIFLILTFLGIWGWGRFF